MPINRSVFCSRTRRNHGVKWSGMTGRTRNFYGDLRARMLSLACTRADASHLNPLPFLFFTFETVWSQTGWGRGILTKRNRLLWNFCFVLILVSLTIAYRARMIHARILLFHFLFPFTYKTVWNETGHLKWSGENFNKKEVTLTTKWGCVFENYHL